MRQERGNSRADSSSYSNNNMALLQMRWLRLVVDEGHEIGEFAFISLVWLCFVVVFCFVKRAPCFVLS